MIHHKTNIEVPYVPTLPLLEYLANVCHIVCLPMHSIFKDQVDRDDIIAKAIPTLGHCLSPTVRLSDHSSLEGLHRYMLKMRGCYSTLLVQGDPSSLITTFEYMEFRSTQEKKGPPIRLPFHINTDYSDKDVKSYITEAYQLGVHTFVTNAFDLADIANTEKKLEQLDRILHELKDEKVIDPQYRLKISIGTIPFLKSSEYAMSVFGISRFLKMFTNPQKILPEDYLKMLVQVGIDLQQFDNLDPNFYVSVRHRTRQDIMKNADYMDRVFKSPEEMATEFSPIYEALMLGETIEDRFHKADKAIKG